MSMFDDLRLAVRRLVQRPAFSLAVVLILGIGMGASTALLDLTNLLVWRLWPVEQPQQLVKSYTASQRGFVGPYNLTAYRDYLDYRDGNRSFSGLAAHSETEVRLTHDQLVERVSSMAVSGNFFEVIGLEASVGRVLIADDDRRGAAPAMMLGHDLWQRLGGDRELVGATLELEGQPFQVVGVVPPHFTGTYAGSNLGVFYPVTAMPLLFGDEAERRLEDRNRASVDVVGRLNPGVSRSMAGAELIAMAQRLDRDHPLPEDARREVTTTAATVVHPIDRARMAPTLRLFAGAVALLLVITCANIAHLLLARSTTRRREWGIRQSIGAGRGRLLRQVLTENLVLALAGGACGVLLAYWARGFLEAYAGDVFAGELRFDLRVLGGSFAVCLLATLLFGLAPALAAARVDLVAALKGGVTDHRQRRFSAGKLLSAAQVALCVVLLAAGSLLALSLWHRLDADLGFDDDRVIVARFGFPEAEISDEEERAYARELQQRVAALPMVEDAGLSFLVPPILFDLELPYQLPGETGEPRRGRFNFVSDRYFETLGIPLERGRHFDSRDIDGPPVVIVNRRIADQLWPGEDPIGRTLISASRRPQDPGPEYEVIGVVGNIAQHRSGLGGEAIVYYSLDQRYRRHYKLLMRSEADVAVVSEALRGVAADLGGLRIPTVIQTGPERRREAFTFELMQAQAVGLFAVLGLLLAALGIFGVFTYRVSRRVREVGIRMALGARRRDVFRLIVGQGMMLTLIGIAIGLVGALWSSPLLESLLYGVQPRDLRVLAGVVAVVLLAAFAAAYLPARRASRFDPLVALRHD
ncbi:MAG: ADOP family duplicated permease [Acidobacteriota bacterium]